MGKEKREGRKGELVDRMKGGKEKRVTDKMNDSREGQEEGIRKGGTVDRIHGRKEKRGGGKKIKM